MRPVAAARPSACSLSNCRGRSIRTRGRRRSRPFPAIPYAFGVFRRPAVGRRHRDPTVELAVAIIVAVAGRHSRRVGHVESDLPERDDRVPPHRRGAVASRRFLEPVRPVEQQSPATTTRWGRMRAAGTARAVPGHGGAATRRRRRLQRTARYGRCRSAARPPVCRGSRREVSACHSGLAFGGPTHSTDENPISSMSGMKSNAP